MGEPSGRKESNSIKWPRDKDRRTDSLIQTRSTLAYIDEAKWGRGKKSRRSFLDFGMQLRHSTVPDSAACVGIKRTKKRLRKETLDDEEILTSLKRREQ